MAIESQGFLLEMETGSGGAVTLTDIAVGYPTILTKSDHGLSNGDVVTLANFAGDNAADINGQVKVVMFATDDTFAVDLDTTGKTITDNTNQATATPKALTEIGEVVDWSGPSGSASEIDYTYLRATAKKFMMGLPDEGQWTLNINWEPTDTGQQAAIAARVARAKKSFKATYSDDSTATFDGYVMGVSSSGAVDGKVSGSITIRIDGEVTYA